MTPRLVAIVPAAGLSRRMGQPKLLLDLAGRTVMARVIETLHDAGITRCLVVVRADDLALIQEVTAAGGEVVLPAIDPADMRQSVEWGLRAVGSGESGVGSQKTPCDGWVLVPADHPTLNAPLVRELMAAWSASPSQIAVPAYEGRRGHPTIFPWNLAEEVFRLPPEQGLNHILRCDPTRVQEVVVSDARVLDDLDTPEDLLRLRLCLWAERPVG
jgi:molybdenum cofactor cytidylyltransferase